MQNSSSARRCMRAGALFALALSLIPRLSAADGVPALEISDWNVLLGKEGWRVFLAAPTQQSLSAFIGEPKSFDLSDAQGGTGGAAPSIEGCGVHISILKRNEFTSPYVPQVVLVSKQKSIEMSSVFQEIFRNNNRLAQIEISLRQPVWERLQSSETTAGLYKSPIWANPTLRAALLKCIENGGGIVTESKLTANIEASFFDRRGMVIDLSNIKIDLLSGSLFSGAVAASPYILQNGGVTLGRRRGICIDNSAFFTNSNGVLGNETC
ncbi:hypothetical protein ACEUZ9_005363 [Paracoccus litorisediminis]|uniref:hypothetical protein n=1 Tax=Paracoccus litorisediminis TaxID=2006130 RepID=UPI003733F2B9